MIKKTSGSNKKTGRQSKITICRVAGRKQQKGDYELCI